MATSALRISAEISGGVKERSPRVTVAGDSIFLMLRTVRSG